MIGETIAAASAVTVGIAALVNTCLLIVLNGRQKEGNHHTQTIRALVEKQITPAEIGEAMDKSAKAHRKGSDAGA